MTWATFASAVGETKLALTAILKSLATDGRAGAMERGGKENKKGRNEGTDEGVEV